MTIMAMLLCCIIVFARLSASVRSLQFLSAHCAQRDLLSGKPANAGGINSCQGKAKELTKSRNCHRNVRGEITLGKLFVAVMALLTSYLRVTCWLPLDA